MAPILKHKFTSGKVDGSDATLVQPTRDWNEYHVFTGGNSGALLCRDTFLSIAHGTMRLDPHEAALHAERLERIVVQTRTNLEKLATLGVSIAAATRHQHRVH